MKKRLVMFTAFLAAILCQAEWEAWTPAMLVEKADLIGVGILDEVRRVQANNKAHGEGTIRFSELLKGTTKEVVLKWDVGKPPVEDEIDYAASAGKPLLWFLKRNQAGSFFVPHGDGIQNLSRKDEFKAIICVAKMHTL